VAEPANDELDFGAQILLDAGRSELVAALQRARCQLPVV
jgi:hypothetical protein